MALAAKKVRLSRAAAAAAASTKAKRSKLKKTAAKRFKLNKKRNPRSQLPKRSHCSLIRFLSRSSSCGYYHCCCGCCCYRSRPSHSRSTFKITKKGEQSLRRRIRRRIKSATELRLMRSQLERSQLEPTMALEPSEITVALLSHENANVSEPEEVPPCIDSDQVPNGDLASS
ncbi:cysteine-rich perinuclear theca protein 1-like [Mus caroli]|uniref:Cysteine-rich perinuclear theca protein 1-like n=1 Tax=Mus caroli TaxID=10089 RepID=A0A6P5NZY0_MUSCR|nr:cysteine-rich perinuclear theca protein 1-like [Mus caroli]